MATDLRVWVVFIILLVLLGARAWLVESRPSTSSGGDRELRTVTTAAGVTLIVLVVVVAMEGGALLVSKLLGG